MAMAIRGGRILDPARGHDRIGDLYISRGRIVESLAEGEEARVIDARGLWVAPGLIDAHVHLREPGQEQKEEIGTGLAAAASGGFTAVCAMPNTAPANDSPAITRMMIDKARALGGPALYPVAAVTRGRRGEQLADLAALKAAGAVAFSDDGSAVADDAVMEAALSACRRLGVPLAQHAEDPAIARGGVVHEGEASRRLQVPGWPAEAEERIVARDIGLAKKTGAHLHLCHLSTRGSVALVRQAKKEGVSVTAEATPHHLHLTDSDVVRLGTVGKVNPPLRTRDDVEALRAALADGVVDIVATDHAPHTEEDKQGGFTKAAFGMVGLETALPLLLKLVELGVLSPLRMIEAMSAGPARIFGLPGGTLAPGSPADVTIINSTKLNIVNKTRFRSKGRNTPFDGWTLPGCAVYTIVTGEIVYAFDAFLKD